MKKILLAVFGAAALVLLIPLVFSMGRKKAPDKTPEPPPASEPSPSLTISILDGDQTLTMDLETYLVGVVAGEMPASFEMEALKAQAVAARTYTLYKLYVEPSGAHDQTVCTDPTCCKAYAHEQELRDRWGEQYEANSEKIRQAVDQTRGAYIVYEDEPILAVFHASSPGRTEDSGDVWQTSLPYLQSVESPEGAADVTNYVTETAVNRTEFTETVQAHYPEAAFPEDTDTWFTGYTYTPSGRVDSVTVGGVPISGKEIRAMFSLRSAAFSATVTEQEVVFRTTGYGHGVGMSQYGANVMAKQGKTWQEILKAYYTGTEIRTLET